MKKSITLLAVTVFVFNVTMASNITETTTKMNAVVVQENEQANLSSLENNPLEKRNFAPVEDHVILNPETVMTASYQKSSEEIIAENNQIIESNIKDEGILYFAETPIENIIQQNNQIIESENTTEIRPLYLERTIEDQIAEDNSIIESDIVAVSMVLDFNIINQKAFSVKQSSNTLVGMN
jgi:hypothetical protein